MERHGKTRRHKMQIQLHVQWFDVSNHCSFQYLKELAVAAFRAHGIYLVHSFVIIQCHIHIPKPCQDLSTVAVFWEMLRKFGTKICKFSFKSCTSFNTWLLFKKKFLIVQDLNVPPFYLEIGLIKSFITVGSSPPVTVEERALLEGPFCC